jgi:hypothetical protein
VSRDDAATPLRVVFETPVRPVGVLVDGQPASTALRARTPHEEWIELAGEPADDLGGERMRRRLLLASEVEVAVAGASNVEIHLDYELEALRAFAARTRLDFTALAYGIESFDTFHGYRILNARPGECDTLDAIAVSRRAGRLGNNLMQVLHATNAAHVLGVARIFVPEMPWFEIPAAGVQVRELTYHGFGAPGEIEGCSLYGTFLFEDLEPAVGALDASGSWMPTPRSSSRVRRSRWSGRPSTSRSTSVQAISSTAWIRIRTSSNLRSLSTSSRSSTSEQTTRTRT